MSDQPIKDLFKFINWCEPLVCDVIRIGYENICPSDVKIVHAFSLLHSMYFRKILSDDKRLCEALHHSLISQISENQLPVSVIEKITNAVVDELRSVAVMRFMNSRFGLIDFLKVLDGIREKSFSNAMLVTKRQSKENRLLAA